MGIQNRDGALYFATGVDNTGLYSGRREAIGIIKAMAGEITSFDVFGGIGISAGIAFAQAAKGAYDFEKQFQQSMKEVATLSSGIKGSLTDYMNQVMEVTREVPILANDAAKALYQIVSAGHDGADGMKILEVSAKAAIGGVTDTATAADGITTLLNAYKLDVSQAEKISDQLFTTVKLGKTSFGELGQSIAQAAPVAAAYGVEIDQVLAAVATLTKQGTPTAQAMTQIRASIIAVSKVLGDGAFDNRTYQEALAEVAKQAGGSESKLRELVPEVEAVNAVLGLTGINVKEAAGHLKEMQNATGAAEEAFKEMASSAQNQLQLLQNNVTAFLRPMGETILKEVSEIASSFNEAFNNGDVQESMKTLGDLIVIGTSALVGYKGSIIAVSAAKKIHASLLEMERYEMLLYRKAVEAGTISENVLTTAQVKQMATRKAMITTVKLHTAALKRNIVALTTNPYVLAAAAVAALGYTIYKVVTYQSDMEKMQSKLNNAMKEAEKSSLSEQRELVKLKGELSSLTKGTDEYNIVKDKIVKGFGKYYSGLDAEIEKVGLTETAYNKLTEAINKSFGARQYEIFASEQQEALSNTMADNLEKIQKRLISRLGDEAGSKIFAKIRDSIIKGTLSFGKSSLLDIQGLDSETKAALDQISGAADKKWVQNHELEGYIKDIILANQMTDELDKKARERFGIVDDSKKNSNADSEEKVESEKKAGTEWLSIYKKNYEDAEKVYNDFLKSKKIMSDAERDEELKRLKGLRDTAKTTYESKGGVTNTSMQEDKAEKLRQETEKYKQLLDNNKRDQSRAEVDAQNEVDQSIIDAMETGSAKTLAQRKLNHKKEIEAIRREAEDRKQQLIDAAKAEFEANPANAKKSFNINDFLKDKSVQGKFSQIDEQADRKERSSNIMYNRGDDFSSLLDEYQDYTDKRLAIEKKYNDDIMVLRKQREQAEKDGNTSQVEQIDRSIAQATKEKGKSLMGLDYDKLKESPEYVRAFENLKETSSETLNSLLTQLESAKQTAAEVLSPDQLREYTTTIQDIMNELDERNPFQALADRKQELAEAEAELAEAKKNLDTVNSGGKVLTGTSLNKDTGKIEKTYLTSAEALEKYNKAKDKTVKADAKVQTAEKKVDDVMGELFDSIKGVGNAIGGEAGEIINLIGDIGQFALMAMDGVKTASETASTAVQTVEKASVILAIISAAIQIATKIASLFKSTDYMAEFRKEMEQLNYELELAKLNAEISTDKNSIFGDDLWGNAIKNVDLAREALDRYNGTLDKIKNRKIFTDFAGATAEAMGLKNTYKSLGDSIANMQVKIQHKTWFRSAKYSSLKDAVPELFNADGTVNQDALEKFIGSDTFGKLSQENQQYLQEMSDYWKAYQEAVEKVRDYLTDIFGELGGTLTDTLVDSWANGTDAATAYYDSVSEMLESLGKQMIYSTIFGDIFEKAQQKMLAVTQNADLSADEKFKEYIKLLGGMTDEVLGKQGDFNALLEAYQQMAKDKGFDIFKPDDESEEKGVSGKLEAAMTEGTASELVGLWNMTAMDIRVLLNLSSEHFSECRRSWDITYSIWEETQKIASNTERTANNTDGLVEKLEDGLKSVKDELSEIRKNTKNNNSSRG